MGRAVGGTAGKARILAEARGVDDLDGHALAGFIEAEGSFVIARNNAGRNWLCAMTLNQRADDADMLLDVVRVTGLGRLHAVPARRSSRPQVVWSVSSKLECRELAGLLRRYPLRGRKCREARRAGAEARLSVRPAANGEGPLLQDGAVPTPGAAPDASGAGRERDERVSRRLERRDIADLRLRIREIGARKQGPLVR